MNFYTRKWVKPEDLNPNGSLFGGTLLRWIDEEAVIYAIVQLGNPHVVTKYISEINFVSSAKQGDIIELGIEAIHFGNSSLTMRCEVRNKISRKTILSIDKLVFVNLDPAGNPVPHGKTKITYDYMSIEKDINKRDKAAFCAWISRFKSFSTQKDTTGIKLRMKYLTTRPKVQLYVCQQAINSTTKRTTRNPWMEPATRTASGMPAKYFKGIATKNNKIVEMASQRATC